jgi:Uma2 family endonuclease
MWMAARRHTVLPPAHGRAFRLCGPGNDRSSDLPHADVCFWRSLAFWLNLAHTGLSRTLRVAGSRQLFCYTAGVPASARLPVHMSVQDFFAWHPNDGLQYELVDGVPRAMVPPTTIHGFLQSELARTIGNHLRESGSRCLVLTNPGVIPHMMASHNARIPDLGVTCSPLRAGQIEIPDPVVLVEIRSPGNQAETWSNVWTYTSIPSAREILILHSTRVAAELLRRGPAGDWPQQPELLRGDELILTTIGFSTSLAQLYARTGLPADGPLSFS